MHTLPNFRLLVVRLGAMGDILHALPAVTALRRAHPDWQIGWVVEPRWRALLTTGNSRPSEQKPLAGDPGREQGIGNRPQARRGEEPEVGAGREPGQPLVDRLHFATTKQWARRPLSWKTVGEIAALRRELRTARYDAAIDLQGAIRSAVIGRMAGCSRVIGEDEPREGAARWLFTERISTHGAHVIEQDVELASTVAGDALTAVAPLLPVDPAADAWCDALLAASAGQAAALINPGAGWGAKRWPAERYAAVAQGLAERGLRVLVNAGPGEEALAEEVVSGSGGAAQALTATLDRLIALTRRIALCVAGDTGPLHLACALGRPVVGIYGPTDPSRNGPFGSRFAVLRSPDSRRDHTRHAAPEAGLLTIGPEDVLRAADKLLAEDGPA